MVGRRRKAILIVGGILLALFGIVLIFETGEGPSPPLPNPNGYDDFLKAGEAISGDLGKASTLDHEQLSALILANTNSLDRLRIGLSRQCAVPISDSLMTNLGAMMADLPRLTHLAELLAAQGRLAEMEDRPGDAANSYVDAVRLGNEISKGGLVINRFVGIAIERIVGPLGKLVPKLSCEQARTVIAALVNVDDNGVQWDDVLRAEHRYARHEFHQAPFASLAGWWANRRAIEQARESHYLMLTRIRLLAAELALRCYRSAHGNPPDRLEQLTPDYLPHTLLDPFSDQLLAYRRQGTNWLLYSFGVDRKDDGGNPIGRSVSGTLNRGDLFYDSPW